MPNPSRNRLPHGTVSEIARDIRLWRVDIRALSPWFSARVPRPWSSASDRPLVFPRHRKPETLMLVKEEGR
jgi:hypothetical protein